MSDRRREPRDRQVWQPHPDQIRECVGVWEFYRDLPESEMPIEDKIRRVLAAAQGWQERQDAEERRHAKAQEIAHNVSVRSWSKPFDPDACRIHDSDTDPERGR